MLQITNFDIHPYLDLASRRRWWILLPLAFSVTLGIVFLKISPKSFRASTLILLEPQSIPDSFVKSTVTESIEGRLKTITQQIQSRTNLERLVRDFNLVQSPSSAGARGTIQTLKEQLPFFKRPNPSQQLTQQSEQVALMGIIDQLKNSLEVAVRSGGSGGGAARGQNLTFEVSFEWNDPEIVAPVANTIASRFIEDNLNAREEMAISTTDFLDKETGVIRVELEARERELEAFKKEHMGMLPDQLESNINVMNQLRDQLLSLQRSLDQEKQQALMIKSQAQMARIEREALANSIRQEQGRTGGTRRDQQLTTEELTSGTLEELETELRRLSTAYTEKHPDVIALKRRIDAMKKEGTRAASGNPPNSPDTGTDRVNVQLVPINANIESYKNQIREVEKQLQTYKERVERTPQVEMALNKILRDYETVQQRYDDLLKKKLDAKLAEQMEKRKKGEQFRVLDPAIRPPKPFKPDAKRVMAMAFALGLGLGCGLAYLREMLDPAFYSPEDVSAFLELPVMVSIPMADMEKEA